VGERDVKRRCKSDESNLCAQTSQIASVEDSRRCLERCLVFLAGARLVLALTMDSDALRASLCGSVIRIRVLWSRAFKVPITESHGVEHAVEVERISRIGSIAAIARDENFCGLRKHFAELTFAETLSWGWSWNSALEIKQCNRLTLGKLRRYPTARNDLVLLTGARVIAGWDFVVDILVVLMVNSIPSEFRLP
jgi:hypothetical protein